MIFAAVYQLLSIVWCSLSLVLAPPTYITHGRSILVSETTPHSIRVGFLVTKLHDKYQSGGVVFHLPTAEFAGCCTVCTLQQSSHLCSSRVFTSIRAANDCIAFHSRLLQLIYGLTLVDSTRLNLSKHMYTAEIADALRRFAPVSADLRQW